MAKGMAKVHPAIAIRQVGLVDGSHLPRSHHSPQKSPGLNPGHSSLLS
jgi:hypothetical protein